jgi:hypothetical protein
LAVCGLVLLTAPPKNRPTGARLEEGIEALSVSATGIGKITVGGQIGVAGAISTAPTSTTIVTTTAFASVVLFIFILTVVDDDRHRLRLQLRTTVVTTVETTIGSPRLPLLWSSSSSLPSTTIGTGSDFNSGSGFKSLWRCRLRSAQDASPLASRFCESSPGYRWIP